MTIKETLAGIVFLGACALGGCSAPSSSIVQYKEFTPLEEVVHVAKMSLREHGYRVNECRWKDSNEGFGRELVGGSLRGTKEIEKGFATTRDYKTEINIKEHKKWNQWKYSVHSQSKYNPFLPRTLDLFRGSRRELSEENEIIKTIQKKSKER